MRKEFKSEIFKKEFHLNWRLRKPMNIQLDTHKVCNYFGKKEVCPFESIGCMFLHLDKPQDQDAQSEDAV